MSINKNNYEIWLIDYLDGNLDYAQQDELMLFLDSNPDIKEEFEGMQNAFLEDDFTSFSKKEDLKKPEIKEYKNITESNYEEYFIAYNENDLDYEKNENLTAFLKFNPHLVNEFELHKKLILPTEEYVFVNKAELRKQKRFILTPTSISTIAAAIMILFTFYFALKNEINGNKRIEFPNINPTPSYSLRKINNLKDDEIAMHKTAKKSEFVKINQILQPEYIVSENSQNIVSNNSQSIASNGSQKIISLQSRNSEITIVEGNEIALPILNDDFGKTEFGETTVNILARVIEKSIQAESHREEKLGKKDPGLVKFLQRTITVFNTVTGSKLEQKKVYNKYGELQNYKVETPLLTLNKNYSIPSGE